MHTTLKFRRSPSKCIHSGHCHCQCDWVALWENGHKNTSKSTAAYDRDIPFNSLIILKGLGEFRIRIRLGAPLRLASFLRRVGCGVELVNWLDCLDVWMLRCIDMLGCMFGCAWMFGGMFGASHDFKDYGFKNSRNRWEQENNSIRIYKSRKYIKNK